jgi:hypothetical protein
MKLENYIANKGSLLLISSNQEVSTRISESFDEVFKLTLFRLSSNLVDESFLNQVAYFIKERNVKIIAFALINKLSHIKVEAIGEIESSCLGLSKNKEKFKTAGYDDQFCKELSKEIARVKVIKEKIKRSKEISHMYF